jgi:enoyl-CoA hydratase
MFKNLFLVLIDKDHQPKWNPGTLQDVTAEKVDSYFESLGENELKF